jgi:pimeloyl-ACP methyl ester carboxylesterase
MRLLHARTALELHELSHRDGPALLLLHSLGGSSVDWSEAPALWPGRVYALDFSGHGRSEWVCGGVYMPELLSGDADAALAHIGAASIAGAGIGAYVALLLAGGRSEQVPAALLLPGRGLDGGGARPDFDRDGLSEVTPPTSAPLPPGCDPLCRALQVDVRPPEYAAHFAAGARRVLLLEDGGARPPWWERARQAPGAQAVNGDVRSAFGHLAEAAGARLAVPLR